MSNPMKARARVAAPVDKVRHALTDAGELRAWFAEHAEVELPGRYEFWGRYTPEGDAPHQRLLHADDRTLRFTWLLDGVETTTEIELERESDSSTIVSLTQSHFDFQEMMSGSSIRGVLQTFWALSIANLADHLEGRALTAKVDFTSPELRAETLIDASPAEVYASLVDSATVTRWFGFPIEIEPRVGGRFAMGGFDNDPSPALIVDLEQDRRMSIDWGANGIGTWELEESGGKTRLTLVQSGFAGATPYAAWTGTVSGFAELRRFHELEDWRPIWLQDEVSNAG